MKTIVCLPTKNEKKSIKLMIDKIKNLGLPLFIVDSNSKDGTIEIAKKNRIEVFQSAEGKGCGVQKALVVAKKKKFDILFLIDCDNTYPCEDIPKFISYFPEYDKVIGVRNMKDITFLHRLPNMFHTFLLNILFFGKLHDINSGMRAFKIDKLKELNSKGFDIEAEMSCKALKNRLKIKEVPITYKKRIGDSKIRVKDGFIILWRIIKERFVK